MKVFFDMGDLLWADQPGRTGDLPGQSQAKAWTHKKLIFPSILVLSGRRKHEARRIWFNSLLKPLTCKILTGHKRGEGG